MVNALVLVVYYQGVEIISYPLKETLVSLGSSLTKVDYLLPFPGVPDLALVLMWHNEGGYQYTKYEEEGIIKEQGRLQSGQTLSLAPEVQIVAELKAQIEEGTRRLLPDITSPSKGQITYETLTLPVGAVLMVGKGTNNDLVIADDYLSQNHFVIIKQLGRYFIRDLGSTNGTMVDGHLVVEAELPADCRIRAGESLFHFQISKEPIISEAPWHGLVGDSPAMIKLHQQIELAAQSNLTVLLHGETGSGKELVARAIYELSFPEGQVPYLVRNCATFTENLLGSELFGHKRGAFTGAVENRVGAFVAANNGCLFLDELGEMPLNMQPALLRAVEYGEVTPLGSNSPVKVKVRLIGATHRNLRQMVKAGTFREDLFYRLSVFPIEIPPLRERGSDVLILAHYFLKHYGVTARTLSTRAEAKLLSHNWPGNVRELANAIQLTVCHSNHSLIEAEDLIIPMYDPAQILVKTETSTMPNRDKILEILRKNHGNKSRAAKEIGIARSTMYRLLRNYEIGESEIM